MNPLFIITTMAMVCLVVSLILLFFHYKKENNLFYEIFGLENYKIVCSENSGFIIIEDNNNNLIFYIDFYSSNEKEIIINDYTKFEKLLKIYFKTDEEIDIFVTKSLTSKIQVPIEYQDLMVKFKVNINEFKIIK